MIAILAMTTLLIGGVFLTYILGMLDRRAKRINRKLDDEIEEKYSHLDSLESEIQIREYDSTVNMHKTVIEVLDIYDKSNIKIPLDIIEDVMWMKVYEPNEILEYIETQRQHWKLENSKRVPKKVIK